MIINLNETIQAITGVGAANARAVPMPGKTMTEEHQIEIKKDGTWQTIVTGITKSTAEGIISSATNRVILG